VLHVAASEQADAEQHAEDVALEDGVVADLFAAGGL
jgi:hypothetical protein